MEDHIIIKNCKRDELIKIVMDPEDYDRVTSYKWHLQSGRDIVRCNKLDTSIQKFILGITEKGRTAYHIDGNPWNNKKSNLQECSIGKAISYTRSLITDLDIAYHANTYIFQSKKNLVSFM